LAAASPIFLWRALEMRGITADLAERQDGATVGGAELYLPGNGARAVDRLGLLAEVIAKAAPAVHPAKATQRSTPLRDVVSSTSRIGHRAR
jgi:hypothetical protein